MSLPLVSAAGGEAEAQDAPPGFHFDASRPQAKYEFQPFSTGMRTCPGQNLASMEVPLQSYSSLQPVLIACWQNNASEGAAAKLHCARHAIPV